MKSLFLLLLALIVLTSCKHKMSVEELEKANWTTISNGLAYINMEKDTHLANPHFHFKLIAVSSIDSGMQLKSKPATPDIDSTLNELLKGRLNDSRYGYLKYNPSETLLSVRPLIHIFLRDGYDSSNLTNDIITIRNIEGVKDVDYISKEKAKEIYLADGNENWDKVLDKNPLPATINLSIDPSIIKPNDFDSLKMKLKQIVPMAHDIDMPLRLREWEIRDFIFEYTRE
ncbi:MAG: permease-like cell division protein FtsX [Chitinophagaceae bacterium]